MISLTIRNVMEIRTPEALPSSFIDDEDTAAAAEGINE
jgi:hypothetical protein